MHAYQRIATFLLMGLSMAAATTVHAQDGVRAQEMIEWWPRAQYYVQSEVSLDQAAQMAEKRFNARVVKAETVRNGDRRVHQIRLLNAQGKVWKVSVDAETGQMF
jgi:uncharacterized membrane protein YkoI